MQTENLFAPNKIRLFSGHYFDPFNPDPEAITIENVAHGLSNVCRFGGHTKAFFSVANHSIGVSDWISTKQKEAGFWRYSDVMAGLLHDASEGLGLFDIPKPIKDRMPEYKAAEERVMKMVAQKFGFEWPLSDIVKQVDADYLQWEWDNLVIGDLLEGGRVFITPEETRVIFLRTFKEISK